MTPLHTWSPPFHLILSSRFLTHINHITSSCVVWHLLGLNYRLGSAKRRGWWEGITLAIFCLFLWLLSREFALTWWCPFIEGHWFSQDSNWLSSFSSPCSLSHRGRGSSATIGLCFLLYLGTSFNLVCVCVCVCVSLFVNIHSSNDSPVSSLSCWDWPKNVKKECAACHSGG